VAELETIPAEESPVITGLPEMVGLVKVLLVRVCVAEFSVTVPVVFGRVMVLS
jgi:hypothetical protein